MLQKAALYVGIVFLVIGIAGFIPGLTVESNGVDKLLGLFQVDTMHNLVHILSGLAFVAASRALKWSRLVFQAMAAVYALVTIIGFIVGPGNTVLGLFHVNTADNLLHLVLALIFIYFGFAILEARQGSDTPAAPAS